MADHPSFECAIASSRSTAPIPQWPPPWICFEAEELMRIDRVTCQAGKRFLAAQIGKRFQNFALQPLQQFQRDVKEIPCPACIVRCPWVDEQKRHQCRDRE